MGCHLTTLFGSTDSHKDSTAAPLAYKKHGWLPLLTVLFILSYGLLTMLVVEQGSTIESQRALIRELFRDSTELSAVKEKAIQNKNTADTKRRAEAQEPLAKGQSQPDQSPSQDASNQAAANHAATQRRAGKKQELVVPSRPAADLADDRRALITI